MLSSTGNDVESGANGFRVSRGDSLAENDGASQIAREESVSNDQPSSVRSSSAVQRSAKSSSQDHDDPLSPSAVHGSTPLSQIGAHPCAPVNDMYLGQGKCNPCEPPTLSVKNWMSSYLVRIATIFPFSFSCHLLHPIIILKCAKVPLFTATSHNDPS